MNTEFRKIWTDVRPFLLCHHNHNHHHHNWQPSQFTNKKENCRQPTFETTKPIPVLQTDRTKSQ